MASNRTEIIRVWGKADEFDIEFIHEYGTRWTCRVPPDTVDGRYAVEIWATNRLGETAYWTGELYMCNGLCHLKIRDLPYRIWFKPISKSLHIRKGCSHGR